MNYETTLADVGGAPNAMIEDIEIDGARTRRKRIFVAVAVLLVLVLVAVYMMSRGSKDDAALSKGGNAQPTVTVVEPGRSTVTGVINATGSLAATHEIP